MQRFIRTAMFIALSFLFGCTSINYTPSPSLQLGQCWGIVPFANNTEVPQVGYRAMAISASEMRAKGVASLVVYGPRIDCTQLLVCPNSANLPLKQVRAWAREHDIRYVMTGTVNEWHYKVGLDGEPAAAVTLQLYDMQTEQVIWSAVGSRVGTSHSSLGNIGQILIAQMLTTLLGH